MASISYGILVCNEVAELDRLLGNLTAYIRPEDEIIVLIDKVQESTGIVTILGQWRMVCDQLHWYRTEFGGNFAERRNELAALCTKDWVFQVDADELVDLNLLIQLPKILDEAGDVEAFALARVNTVTGLTQEDIDKWHWNVNERGWVNWPDWQIRLYRNDGTFHWHGEVHEHLGVDGRIIRGLQVGLYHPKDIERQRRQNAFYDTYNR